jgi:hypothetical protein
MSDTCMYLLHFLVGNYMCVAIFFVENLYTCFNTKKENRCLVKLFVIRRK